MGNIYHKCRNYPSRWKLAQCCIYLDKGGDGMKLYIDGVLVGSNAYNTASFSDWGSGQNFYLGKANWNDPILMEKWIKSLYIMLH